MSNINALDTPHQCSRSSCQPSSRPTSNNDSQSFVPTSPGGTCQLRFEVSLGIQVSTASSRIPDSRSFCNGQRKTKCGHSKPFSPSACRIEALLGHTDHRNRLYHPSDRLFRLCSIHATDADRRGHHTSSPKPSSLLGLPTSATTASLLSRSTRHSPSQPNSSSCRSARRTSWHGRILVPTEATSPRDESVSHKPLQQGDCSPSRPTPDYKESLEIGNDHDPV